DEHDQALDRLERLEQPAAPLATHADAQDLLQALERAGRAGAWEHQLVALVGPQAGLDVLGGLVGQPRGDGARGAVLGVRVGVERQHRGAQRVLDRRQGAARRYVVGVGDTPAAEGRGDAGALSQHVAAQLLDHGSPPAGPGIRLEWALGYTERGSARSGDVKWVLRGGPSRQSPEPARPDPRWRHGYDDPAGRAGRGGLQGSTV